MCDRTRDDSGNASVSAVSPKSTRNDLDRRQFPHWNGITPFFVRRCNLGLREIGHEGYTSTGVALKKEIPVQVTCDASTVKN